MTEAGAQQVLRLDQPRTARFDAFWPGPNEAALTALQDFCATADEGQYLLRGEPASGKSHLLQAACRDHWEAGRPATYLNAWQQPLAVLGPEQIPADGLLAVDQLEALSADDEMMLLRLIDRSRAAGGRLLLALRSGPTATGPELADLRSRLNWGVVLELRLMDETALAAMLAHRARGLGVVLPEASVAFLLRRLPRDPGSLTRALELAYQRAVEQSRKLTVPFLRELLRP